MPAIAIPQLGIDTFEFDWRDNMPPEQRIIRVEQVADAYGVPVQVWFDAPDRKTTHFVAVPLERGHMVVSAKVCACHDGAEAYERITRAAR